MDFFPQVSPYSIYVFIQQAHAHSVAKTEKILINKHLVSCHLLMGKERELLFSTLVMPKSLWCWEGLWAGGKGDDRGWDGWMASLTRWMWVWVNSGSWCWTGRPGVLRFMGLQSHTRLSDWSELNCTELISSTVYFNTWEYDTGHFVAICPFPT